MKLRIFYIAAVFLIVLFQISAFSGWSLNLFGEKSSPQIFVIIAIFLLFEFKDTYVWYFAFCYFFFYDLIARPSLPGASLFLILLALVAIKLLRGKVFKKSILSDSLFFILFSVFFRTVVYRELSLSGGINQVITNLLMLTVLYPLLSFTGKLLKSNSPIQMSLRV
jgi:hypothetical protein